LICVQDLFFQYQFNNMLHTLVEGIIQTVLDSPSGHSRSSSITDLSASANHESAAAAPSPSSAADLKRAVSTRSPVPPYTRVHHRSCGVFFTD